jgi:alkylhydroperoxidase family enzyme
MNPMYLPDVERPTEGPKADIIARLQRVGAPVPHILHLLAYKPSWTDHLERFTQGVMRGPSPLSPGLRELIAAYTSRVNRCEF